ncbi:flavodoxin [Pseudoxanthomonas kalamensis DSM 18571]|uniref:flavodoxin family protein n=1 Tax=Pseudoxanthomonas kalamensis TaxID=289483 RepID=UPI0013909AB3|nr:NAD(P)H-dependent oxidoreductase [Pseudoxanthomonas kalamensis]KAF1708813.1 flavodoxin [Pseudoxanthomonas kalamensis DSM 18571]
MKTLLFVWHSQTGGTAAMVEAAVQAAREHAEESGLQVRSLRAEEAGADDVLAADAVVFATPENLAAISGRLKDFFDRSYYALLDRCEGKPCGWMVCAGSDGQAAIAQLRRIATGLRLREVAEPVLVCTHAQTPQAILARKRLDAVQLAPCRELGATLAAGLALGLY